MYHIPDPSTGCTRKVLFALYFLLRTQFLSIRSGYRCLLALLCFSFCSLWLLHKCRNTYYTEFVCVCVCHVIELLFNVVAMFQFQLACHAHRPVRTYTVQLETLAAAIRLTTNWKAFSVWLSWLGTSLCCCIQSGVVLQLSLVRTNPGKHTPNSTPAPAIDLTLVVLPDSNLGLQEERLRYKNIMRPFV